MLYPFATKWHEVCCNSAAESSLLGTYLGESDGSSVYFCFLLRVKKYNAVVTINSIEHSHIRSTNGIVDSLCVGIEAIPGFFVALNLFF
jgi:hypothetical protein